MATIEQATPPIIPETATLPPEDQGIIERFKARIAEFRDLFARLRGVSNQVPAELQGEYHDLISRGSTIQSTIDTITGGINKAVDWFKGAFGMDAVGMARQGQLGLIPLLPVAAITASLALIGYWITDTMKFIKKMNQFEELRAQGVSASEAAQAVQTTAEGPPIFGVNMQQWVLPLVIFGGVWWFMRNKGF